MRTKGFPLGCVRRVFRYVLDSVTQRDSRRRRSAWVGGWVGHVRNDTCRSSIVGLTAARFSLSSIGAENKKYQFRGKYWSGK